MSSFIRFENPYSDTNFDVAEVLFEKIKCRALSLLTTKAKTLNNNIELY